MKKTSNKPIKAKTQLFSALFILVMIGVTFYVISKKLNLSNVIDLLKDANPLWLLGAFVCSLGYVFFQGYTIYFPMRAFGSKVSLKRCVAYSAVGYYYSSITPSATGGQPMQMYYMTRDKENLSDVSLMVIISNVIYQMTVLALAIIMIVLTRLKVLRFVAPGNAFVILGIIISLGFSLLLLTVLKKPSLALKLGSWAINLGDKWHLVKHKEKALAKLSSQITSYAAGEKVMTKNKSLLIKEVIVTAVQMLLLYLVPFMVYCSFKATVVTFNTFLLILAVQSIIQISVCFIPLPGGVGLSEALFTLFMMPIFGLGYTVPSMILSRFFSFYIMLLVDGAISLYVHLTPRGKVGQILKVVKLSDLEIKDIYKNSLPRIFPANELKEFSVVEPLLKGGKYFGYGFFDNKKMLCFALFIKNRNSFLLDYLAVKEAYRGEGLGSTFLTELSTFLMSPPRTIYLEIEDPDKTDDEHEILVRKKRLDFYMKNGFFDSGVRTNVLGADFWILANLFFRVSPKLKVKNAIKRFYDEVGYEEYSIE